MINSKKIASAFALGVEVATGTIMQNQDGIYSREERVHNETKARAWIDAIVDFHAAHSNAPDTANPDEVRAALEAAYEAGKASGIAVPVPTVPAAPKVAPEEPTELALEAAEES
jgi:uncharacterized protein YjlB